MKTAAIPYKVLNMQTVLEDGKVVNKMEVMTEFDFELINQILTSEPIACPLKPGFEYVHVVLLAKDKPLPLIVPYLYKQNDANDLSEWSFTNNELMTVRHTREC